MTITLLSLYERLSDFVSFCIYLDSKCKSSEQHRFSHKYINKTKGTEFITVNSTVTDLQLEQYRPFLRVTSLPSELFRLRHDGRQNHQ